MIVVFYNLILENAVSGLTISDNMKRYSFPGPPRETFHIWQKEIYALMILKVVAYSKYGSFAIVYIWLKIRQK